MIKAKSLLKWTLRVLVVVLILSIASVIFVNRELKKMYGGVTDRVDSFQMIPDGEEIITITNVNILSPNADSIINNQTILIRGGKIDRIGDQLSIPENSVIIDGTNKFLIPGLIDQHIHLWQSPNDLLLYIANGITTIGELKGSEEHLKWREEIESRERLGPHLFVTTSKFQSKSLFAGMFLHWTQGDVILNNPKKAKQVVQQLMEKGFDAVKIGSFLSKESYIAVNKATKALGVTMTGHIPIKMKLNELWTSNHSNVAHLEEFVKHFNREFGYVNNENKEEFLAFVQKRGEEITQKLLENKISVTTTLWLMESFPQQREDLKANLTNLPLEYVNPGLLEGTFIAKGALGWLPAVNRYKPHAHMSDEEEIDNRAYWETYTKANQALLRILNENGVTIIAGTDANIPTVVPAFSLHEEFESMNRAGMSPSQILRAATYHPAKWMKKKRGKIENGFEADLVLLNANPLENIKNTRSIETVIQGDRIFYRSQLDQMLEVVKEANNKSRKESIDLYLTAHSQNHN